MDDIRSEILNGTHPITEINNKETLRCINEASMMFRDTLRDLDEGDACSEASDVPENSPKQERKAKRRSLAAAGRVPVLDLLRI